MTAITVHRTAPNSITDTVEVAYSNRHNGYSTITEKLQGYADLKEELTRTWQPNAVCMASLLNKILYVSR